MLDAHSAPAAPARPPAVVPAPAIADTAAPQAAAPSKPSALLAAARTLLPVLEAGRPLDARSLRDAMTAAFGASDADGAWVWKDAYEAAEAALVQFIRRYGRAMRCEAGAGPEGPAAMLHMLETLAALEPSQTRRSEEQLRLQQFSTPLPLAYAALQAAAIRPGDVVLEPSAGTGMLAVMAHCAHRQGGRRLPASQRDRRHPRRTPRRALSRFDSDTPQRGGHPGPSARAPPHRGPDEPAVFGEPRRRPHPPRRRPAPHPRRVLDGAAGRASGGDFLRPLRPRRHRVAGRIRIARPAGPRGVHRAHRRPCLCAPRHHLRHPPHRARSGRRAAGPGLCRRPRTRRRAPAPGRRCHRAGAPAHPARAGRRPLRPCPGAQARTGEASPRRSSPG